MTTDQRQDSQNIEFWQARLKQFDNPLKAIGCGFDWIKIDDVHKKIVYPHYTKGMKVLDIGCGIGRTADWFEAQGYVGLDFVPEFIDIAVKAHPDRIFLLYDIKKGLPFCDKFFDIAIGISFKHIFTTGSNEEEWNKTLDEIKRVSKKVFLLPYGNNNPEEIHKTMEIYL